MFGAQSNGGSMPENDLAKTQAITKRKLIENEIKAHGRSWCTHWCRTFNPAGYRHHRKTRTAREVQSSPELCHFPYPQSED